MLPSVQFRCTHCGAYFSLEETMCTQCHYNFLLPATGVLDFVNVSEKINSELYHYDKVYNTQKINGAKETKELKKLWTNPWNPQDQIVLDSLGDLRGKRVLLLGNGHSIKEMFLLSLNPQAMVYSDLSPNAVANIKNEIDHSNFTGTIKFAAIDAQQLPFADETIDIIYGYAMVHHLPNLSDFFSEVVRVLSKDGYSVFMDDAYAPIWHYSKQTFLRSLMKYSHKTSGISPEDYRFSMSGGFREKKLAKQIKTAGGVPWFKRTSFLQYLWYRGVEKILPKKFQDIAKGESIASVLKKIDYICVKLPFLKHNLIRLVWGIHKI